MNKNILEKNYLSDEGFAVYAALRQIKDLKTVDFILYDYVAYLLTGKLELPREFTNKVKSGIENLCDLGLVSEVSQCKKGIELDLSKLYFETKSTAEEFSPFILIQKFELRTIINCGTKFPFKLLRYFVSMVGTISNGTDVTSNKYRCNIGNSPISYIAKTARVSESAAIDYNKILEKLNLIFICRADAGIADSNGCIISGFSNCYGRPQYKEEISDYQKTRTSTMEGVETAAFSKQTDKNRQMTQFYNELKNGKVYPKVKIRAVYNHFLKQNKRVQQGLNSIVKQFDISDTTEEELQKEVEKYRASHELKDVSFLEKLLQAENIDKNSRNDPDNQDDEWDDEHSNFLDSLIANIGTNPIIKPSISTENNSPSLDVSLFRIDSDLVNHYANMINKGIFTTTSVEYDLKMKGYEDNMLNSYMAEIDKALNDVIPKREHQFQNWAI